VANQPLDSQPDLPSESPSSSKRDGLSTLNADPQPIREPAAPSLLAGGSSFFKPGTAGQPLSKATVKTVTFHNPDTGYTVLKVQVGKANATHTVVGHFPRLTPGEILDIDGEWVKHETFGEQFKATAYRIVPPNSLEGMERYLGGGAIKGIGPSLAKKLLREFGEDTFRVLDEEPERLDAIPQLRGRKKAKVLAAWRDNQSTRDVLVFLQTHHLSLGLSHRIVKHYGAQAVEILKRNPYQLAEEMWGIGFLRADDIARKLGFPEDGYERLRAGLVHALARASDEGHVFLPRADLLKKAEELLHAPQDRLVFSLDNLRETDQVKVDEHGHVFQPWLWHCERGIAQRLSQLLGPNNKIDLPLIGEAIAVVEKRVGKGFAFSEEQRRGIVQAVTQGAFLLTGGPGTGKTTTVQGILEALSRSGLTLALCAPTGRAAKRLSEVTGVPASTIHRLLKFDPAAGGFQHDETNPLRVDALIVDELSMIDTALMYHLLKAIKPGMRLILVGDPDQLPSVGPGKVLAELIASDCVSHLHLSTVFRQAQASRIIVNAHRIDRGELPDVSEGGNFHFVSRDESEGILKAAVELAAERFPRRFGYDPLADVQVLTPMNQGPLGTVALNEALQAKFNPVKRELLHKDRRFRVGDKVMQLKNNYDKNVFNGDIGRILSLTPAERTLTVDFEGEAVKYEGEDLDQLQLAYAISIHKSQGSEFKAVVLVLARAHYVMLQRNLLYTAITRAREHCVVVGQWSAIGQSVKNNPAVQRNTLLAEAVRREAGGLPF
jgi:exodeoxyribonuclease V alpha subunit